LNPGINIIINPYTFFPIYILLNKQKKQSTTNLASKRPIQNATETIDIEPLEEQNLVQDNKKSEKFEIDDPW